MPTSGDTVFNLTTQEIIQEALELLGVVGPSESVQSEDYISCLRSLNMLVKSWQQAGLFVTHEEAATLFITPGQLKYQLGGSGPARTALDSTLIETKLSNDYIATNTTLDINSTSGMTATDPVGVVLDDGSVHWTTVSSVTDSNTFVLASGLPSAASSGNYVFSYSSSMGRPLDITTIHLRKTGGTDSELSIVLSDKKLMPLSKEIYLNIYNKGIESEAFQYYAEKKNTHIDLYVYPTGTTVNDRLKITYKRVIEDFTNAADIADLPSNWNACLAYNLAAYVAPKYGKEQKAAQAVAPLANTLLKAAMADIQEKTPFKIIPRT